jgi:anthranilate synthase component 1
VTREGETFRFAEQVPPEVTPLDVLREEIERYGWVDVPGLPRFAGGAVGYLAYDLVRRFERLPIQTEDDLQVDDAAFMFTRAFLAFDHVRHRILIICIAVVEEDAATAYDEAVARIGEMVERLHAPPPQCDPTRDVPAPAMAANLSRRDYERVVARCKEYINAGDAFQIVPSVRFSASVACTPLELYRSLRSINPSPYMYFLDFGDTHVVGSSPEILATVEHGRVRVRPIAGTRPRGKTEGEDARLEAELLADEKERAEHIMLVDLGRNDVGRVAAYGTVVVEDLMTIERYSHVMHIVSNVSGRLAGDQSAFDAVRACFPAGTLTGAPKVRAMEIIEEAEPTRRGLYGGAVGYFSFKGDADFAIAIRTMLVKAGRAHIQAGAGVVADSDPAREYDECVNKARALLNAVELAHMGLD